MGKTRNTEKDRKNRKKAEDVSRLIYASSHHNLLRVRHDYRRPTEAEKGADVEGVCAGRLRMRVRCAWL